MPLRGTTEECNRTRKLKGEFAFRAEKHYGGAEKYAQRRSLLNEAESKLDPSRPEACCGAEWEDGLSSSEPPEF